MKLAKMEVLVGEVDERGYIKFKRNNGMKKKEFKSSATRIQQHPGRPKKNNPATTPEPAPVGEGDIVVEQAIRDMRLRAEIGKKKYGTELRTHNGRKAKTDALQEAHDLLVYLTQDAMETKDSFVESFNAIAHEVHDNSVAKGFWDIPRNDGEALMLVVTELAEGFEALRKAEVTQSDHIPEFTGVEEEMADVIIRIMDLSVGRGWKVAEAMKAKMAFNAGRPYKHGKKF